MSFEFIEPDSRRSIRNVFAAARQQMEQRPERVDSAPRRVTDMLVSWQHPSGYWCGEWTADSTLESDYIVPPLPFSGLSISCCQRRAADGRWTTGTGFPEVF